MDIRELIADLTPREQLVLQLYYGLEGEKTLRLREIGRRLGLSAQRVHQVMMQTLDALRWQMNE